jgi:hypothetical protein
MFHLQSKLEGACELRPYHRVTSFKTRKLHWITKGASETLHGVKADWLRTRDGGVCTRIRARMG